MTIQAAEWAALEPILDRALELPDEARAAFLETACRDPSQRARALRILAPEAATDLLARPLGGAVPGLLESLLARPQAAGSLGAGSRIGVYRVVSLIGEGGMGEVFLAERADGQFVRHVAIKLEKRQLSPAGAGERRERFLRERQILADLRHPHIAQLLDGGVSEDGRPYLVLEHVEGTALVEYCRAHHVATEERVRLVLQACAAVHHAHRKGVLHRDLKPANLLVEASPERGPHLFVLDFGLARQEAAGELTLSGEVMGTPGYMAPEQVRGSLAEVDRRADVFALGVILYELLCGERPFPGAHPLQVLDAVMTATPRRPRDLVAGFPRDLEVIIDTCLEKSPERRYASVRALAEDLERFLDSEPIAARAPGAWRRMGRWMRRYPYRGGVAAGLLLASALGVVFHFAAEARTRRQAVALEQLGRQAEQLVVGLRLAHLAPRHDTAPLRAAVRRDLASWEIVLPATGHLAAPRRAALGRAYLALGDVETAVPLLSAALDQGLTDPEARRALARAHAELYRRGRMEAEREPDHGLRIAWIARLEREHRNPALALVSEVPRPTSPVAMAGASAPLAADAREVEAKLVAAEIALLDGAIASAKRLAGEAIAASPWRYEALLLLGDAARLELRAARAAGDTAAVEAAFDAASAAYREASARGRSDPECHLRRCALLLDRADFLLYSASGDVESVADAAVEACDAAALSDSTAAAPHLERAAVELLRARYRERQSGDAMAALSAAEMAAREAIGRDRASANAHRRLADALALRGELERTNGRDSRPTLRSALAHATLARLWAPQDGGAWNSLGLVRWERLLIGERHGEDPIPLAESAIAAFATATQVAPRSVAAWSNLGALRKERGRVGLVVGEDPTPWFEQALAAHSEASRLDPRYANAFNNAGVVWQEIAKYRQRFGEDPRAAFQRANEQFARASEISPRWAYPLVNQVINHGETAAWMRRQGLDPAPELVAGRKLLTAALELQPGLAAGYVLAAELEITALLAARDAGRSLGPALAAARAALAAAARFDATLGQGTEQALAVALAGGVPEGW